MLQRASGLTSSQLQAIRELERVALEADGGRLKLEWGMLETRPTDEVQDFLWWDGPVLTGFLGLYSNGSSAELTGMVAPAARRRGVASSLLAAGMEACAERRFTEVLLVVPRNSLAGAALARARDGRLDHSEHALTLHGEPAPGPTDPAITLRRAGPGDAELVSRLIESGFGHPAGELALDPGSESEYTLLIDLAGVPVGTLRLTRHDDYGGVYGFVVDPAQQGRGIGRDVLRRACNELRASGARKVGLEVEVDNDRALGLYTSLGFVNVATEDYYSLPRP